MHDAIELTVGDISDHGIQALHLYCEHCGRIERESVRDLQSGYGRQFRARDIRCDVCGRDELHLSPKTLD